MSCLEICSDLSTIAQASSDKCRPGHTFPRVVCADADDKDAAAVPKTVISLGWMIVIATRPLRPR
jgi:hypothetical protein